MRYVVDMIRGMEVNRALGTLKFSSKAASADVEKLLRSAIANWEQKNERKAEDGELFVTKIYVDGGATLKRMRPAPQGRVEGIEIMRSNCGGYAVSTNGRISPVGV